MHMEVQVPFTVCHSNTTSPSQ